MKDRDYEIARYLNLNLNFFFDGYERGFASMVYKFFDKETGSGAIVNKDLAEELYKPVIKKFKVRRV